MKAITHTLLFFVFSGVLFGPSACHSKLLINQYNFSAIDKAEVSDFNANNYKQINCELFLGIVSHSEQVAAKFIPHKEVILYDSDGKLYKLYFSETNQYFQIEGNSFQLSKSQSLALSKLFD
ncbi:MAG: hypothetical protein J6O01_04150 [Bacteroidales bacterium]|nr:hypothetical protein [Bacteroidales bacterium]